MNPIHSLITGSSSGFGLLTARTLLRAGQTVFASMRGVGGKNAEIAEALQRFSTDTPGTVHILELDVTSEDSVENAVRRAIDIGGRIDVAVNNAGLGVQGHAESFTPEEYRRLFEVNLLGVQRVNRAVLPSMRQRGSGLLVHVSSVMGRTVVPFSGPYTASKWALEGLAETYRYELAAIGVDVVIVEPGAFATGIADRVIRPADTDRAAGYGELAEAPQRMWDGVTESLSGREAPDPQAVADAILSLIETPAGERPLRTVVDPLTGGKGPSALNAAGAEIQREMFEAFGLRKMLEPRRHE